MRFLDKDKCGSTSLDEYFDYIESIKDQLTHEAYKFASDKKFYSLQSRSSLHDAWIKNIELFERFEGKRNQIRHIDIRIVLLGPYHDREIVLTYSGVKKYNFIYINNLPASKENQGHGDLFTHEIRINDGGCIEHEMLFDEDNKILIACKDLRCEVVKI